MIHKSHGQFSLHAAEWLHYGESTIFTHLLQQLTEVVNASLAAAEEPFSGSTQTNAAPTETVPSSLAEATSPSQSAAPVASSQDLDNHDKSSALTSASSEMTNPIIAGPSDVAVATDITTLIAPEARTSSSGDTTNIVVKHWADIVSNKEVSSLQMDKWAG
ncbi:hypothetical protein E4T56_gene12418 [Termitomyces sp. T112]|nr:hypothetical protein E4T56_gene12418 [Termitomyces sp. T112]